MRRARAPSARRAALARLGACAALPLAAPLAASTAHRAPPAAVRAAPELHLEIALDPERRVLRGRAEWRLPAGLPAGALRFGLADGLRIDAASLDAHPVPARRIDAEGPPGAPPGWRLEPHTRAHPGARTTVLTLAWSGNLASLDATLDHRAVLGRLPAMASARGAWLPAGSGWYPQLDIGPYRYRLAVRVPAPHKAVAAGTLIEEHEQRDEYRALYEFAHPQQGISLFAGPYTVGERALALGSRRVVLRTWFTAPVAELSGDYLDSSARFLARYDREIGPYAYAGFGVVASPLPVGFGFPGLTLIGESVLRLPFIRATSLGHEVLHNWWGNGVFVDWARGNWSEGLTTYLADYAYREEESPEAARQMRWGWLRDIAALPPGDRQPLRAFIARTHGAGSVIGYGQAAMLFHTLRRELGEQAFRGALRSFYATYLFHSVSWAELQREFERAAGRPLAARFRAWLDETELPQLDLAAARQRPAGATQRSRVAVTLIRSGPRTESTIPVRVRSASDHESVELRSAQHRTVAVIDTRLAAPQAVELDPDFHVWRRLHDGERPPVLREVLLANATALLVAGGETLRAAAEHIALRLIEAGRLRRHPPEPDDALLVVGTPAALDALLAEHGLPAPPPGHAQAAAIAWAARRPGGAPALLVSIADERALPALARALPHLGAHGWVAFDTARSIDRGIHPAQPRSVRIEPEERT
jgi:hypothetical protein